MTASDFDPARLLRDMRKLAEFGHWQTGVHRPTYSPADVDARNWLAGQLHLAGLEAEIDGIGNVIGRSRQAGPALLLGSHVESQPYAGWLDGALGVIYALEIARTFPELPIDVAGFADEEAHFAAFLGSRSFCGLLTEEEIDRSVNRDDGTPLRQALAQAGYAGRPRAVLDPARYRGYFEAHIEQGDELESSGLSIGVVESIVGIWRYRIRFTGEQNHAGTTRMAARRDAGLALIQFANDLHRRFEKAAGPRSVWTVGRITLEPGAPSIVPGGAEMLFQFRDADPAVLARLEQALHDAGAEAGKGPCAVEIVNIVRSAPQAMAAKFQDALERAAAVIAPKAHRRMPSGAGHDAQVLGGVMPVGMVFVPSIGGISHHPAENTKDDDIVLGCRVLAAAVRDIVGPAGAA